MPVERADRGVHLYARLAEDLADLDELRVGGGLRIEIVLGMLRVPRHEVVVVVARHLDEPLLFGVRDDLRDLKRVELRLDRSAERVGEGIPDAPERHRTGVDTQFIVHVLSFSVSSVALPQLTALLENTASLSCFRAPRNHQTILNYADN